MVKRILLAGVMSLFVAGMVVAGDEAETKEPEPVAKAEESKEAEKDKEKKGNPVLLMETSLGNIKLELYPEKAPKTVENFMKYVADGFFDDTIFHRVIKNFMIQGGGFTAEMKQKAPTYSAIPLEAQNGLKNVRGSIAMARTSQPNSATCQFFINHKDNAGLDYPKPDGNGYAVFGKVLEGLEVVDKIADVQTTTVPPHQNVPAEPVLIKSVKEVE